LGATLRQVTDFAGHNCEAQSRLSGPCRFYRGIEREDIGLKSNLIDSLVDPGNVVFWRTPQPSRSQTASFTACK